MFQQIFGRIAEFFTSFGQYTLRPDLIISIGSLLITIIAIIVVYRIYKKHQRVFSVKKIISFLSSFDLLYYNLEKHFKSWKNAKEKVQNIESQKFWRMIDLTETVTNMQEVKTLSKVYLNKMINTEINSLLEFLGDIILISFRGEDLSENHYENKNIITTDDFSDDIETLISRLSRGIGIKINKTPPKEILQKFIKDRYIQK
ncbi:MAG: hypothetical protein PF518_11145 [Spirochaetaceae bacterium]|jgi:hypothetical protein|nr:hypothetical protein [Spirochaetaceae bacterium]